MVSFQKIGGWFVKGISWRIQRFINTLRQLKYHDDPRYQIAKIDSGVRLGSTILKGNNVIGRDTNCVGNIVIGHNSTLGTKCVIWAGDGSIEIGNYCQFAPCVALYAVNHPSSYITSYVNHNLFNGQMQKHMDIGTIKIGNDVWIGYGAIVLKGITIGNGAVIGAGAVVTKDVPPFMIVAGNPARIIKARFDQRIIELLQRLAWWDLLPNQLEAYRELFNIDINSETERSVSLLEYYLQMAGK